MLNKSLDKVKFDNLKELKENKIPESSVIEYKQDTIRDKKLIKEICGMANNQGGHIIFGIKEEKEIEPPGPEKLVGVNLEKMNIQRLEQVINTNIEPRLLVNIEVVENKETNKKFVLIRVPEGSEKPHISKKEERFYMRYNTEARRMTEPEISHMYKERFSGPSNVKKYLKEVIQYHHEYIELVPQIEVKNPQILGHIFIFPSNLNRRRIENIDSGNLKKEPNKIVNKYNIYPISFPKKIRFSKYGISFYKKNKPRKLEIHRNGLIHLLDNYGNSTKKGDNYLHNNYIAEHLIMMLHYCDWIYKKIDYYGLVTIKIHIYNTRNVLPVSLVGKFGMDRCYSINKEIEIEREFSSWNLKDNWFNKVKNIMDEIMNYFGLSSFSYMEEKGKIYEVYKNK